MGVKTTRSNGRTLRLATSGGPLPEKNPQRMDGLHKLNTSELRRKTAMHVGTRPPGDGGMATARAEARAAAAAAAQKRWPAEAAVWIDVVSFEIFREACPSPWMAAPWVGAVGFGLVQRAVPTHHHPRNDRSWMLAWDWGWLERPRGSPATLLLLPLSGLYSSSELF